ncbi:PIN2/TERF1-interacting telomerase inhibitor 1 [Pyxicephalus adspersus]
MAMLAEHFCFFFIFQDNWIAHQDDFNQLLAELNDCHGKGGCDSPADDSKKSFSLEEKSKSSKKRVHYKKFAKGKDLSCRSDTDLACIFGKREKGKKSSQDEADENSEESEEKEPENPDPKCEVDERNTVTSSLSVTEYFAKRMAELKKSRLKQTGADHQSAKSSPPDSADEPKKTKTKKKKHSRSNSDCEESEPVESNKAEDSVHEQKMSKNKKDRCEITESTEEQEEPDEAQDEKLKRKKRKNKRKKETLEICEKEDDSPLLTEDVSTEEPKKKKKKKKQKSDD